MPTSQRLWNETNLENLARTYWRFLSRVTLGLIRVVYGANERSVVFLARPLTLLRFEAPEYDVRPRLRRRPLAYPRRVARRAGRARVWLLVHRGALAQSRRLAG